MEIIEVALTTVCNHEAVPRIFRSYFVSPKFHKRGSFFFDAERCRHFLVLKIFQARVAK